MQDGARSRGGRRRAPAKHATQGRRVRGEAGARMKAADDELYMGEAGNGRRNIGEDEDLACGAMQG